MISDRPFIFQIYISWGKALYLVPKATSSIKIKVKYHGHSFRENGRCGGIRVSQIHLVCISYKKLSSLHYFNAKS